MAILRDPSIWIGETKNIKRLKVYVVGHRSNGEVSVWIEAGAGALRPALVGYPHQESGFDSIEEAATFSKRIFGSPEVFERFVANDFNPVSLKSPTAPRVVQQVVPWE